MGFDKDRRRNTSHESEIGDLVGPKSVVSATRALSETCAWPVISRCWLQPATGLDLPTSLLLQRRSEPRSCVRQREKHTVSLSPSRSMRFARTTLITSTTSRHWRASN